MPDRPETWLIVLAWLSQQSPTLYAAGLSALMAGTRIITIGLIPVLKYFGLPQNLATAAGVFIGFLEVKKLADIADPIAEIRFPIRGAGQ
ncbi:phage holin family protein [Pseudomonas laurylsulfatiphila]|uniref:phage holin family protein n=1 Tax=Pseudomonas laurylsulfatiphila TaxID=2011015 RepID=UPI003D2134F8